MSKNVDPWRAMMLLWYSMPAVAALSFPFASLVGTLLTSARMGADNEILAMQSSGLALRMLFLPIFQLSVVLTLGSFLLNNALLPLGFVNYRNLRDELLFSNTELILEPYGITRFGNTTMVANEVDRGLITSILLFDAGETGRSRIIAAREARLDNAEKAAGLLKLRLMDTQVLEPGASSGSLDLTTLEQMEYVLKTDELIRDSLYVSPAEMSFVDIGKRILDMEADLGSQKSVQADRIMAENALYAQEWQRQVSGTINYPDLIIRLQNLDNIKAELIFNRDLQIHWVEFWKKLTIPMACSTLVILGFPLGMHARRNARGLGLGLGLLIAVFYWSSILAGQYLAINDLGSNGAWYMWAPNIIFVVAGLVLYLIRGRR